MITKSLICLAIIFNLLGINFLSDKFDNALYKLEGGNNSSALADNQPLPLPLISKKPTVNKFASRPVINAKQYLLADMNSGTILLKYNIKDRVPIASTTKIMTAVIALENYKLNDLITISTIASTQIGSDSFLKPGEVISFEQLLYCLLIKSGNDAAYAVAEHLNDPAESGTTKFVSLMNQKATQLGMKDTSYRDPAGLDVTGYSTANDLFLVTKYIMQNKTFRQIVSTKEYVAKSADGSIFHQLQNSNRLVGEYNYPGAVGVKTGYMPESGHCLVSAVEQNDHILVGVVLNTYADNATASADESKKLFDWSAINVLW